MPTTTWRALAAGSALALALATAACSSSSTPVPGVTATQILVGTHQPLTGPASAGYSKISAATKAYFDYVNANGGVYGRKIVYKIMDDGYNPNTTVQVVHQLVLQDKVFAILNGLGTPTHTSVLDYLNSNKVPDLFVASGSRSWNQPQKDPYTFGYNPDYTIEGKIIANYIQQNLSGQKICVFGQNDDFGADGLAGVKDVLTDAGVTHNETYDVANTNVAPQIGAFKTAGCQVVVSFTVPGFTALAIGTAAQLGFRAQWIVSNVGADYATLQGYLKDATPLLLQGMLSTAYLPSTADTANPWVQLFQRLNTQYNNNAAWDGNVEYGFAVGYTFVEALKAAGKNLTRAGLVAAVEKNGFTGPGLSAFRFSATDHSGYGALQMAKIDNATPVLFGPVFTTDDGTGTVTTISASAVSPPANGIP